MRKVKGYDDYWVKPNGDIISTKGKTEKILKSADDGKGYRKVVLSNKGKRRCLFVHRLVAEAYLDDWNPKLQVDHIDRDKLNNNVTNLRMVTQSENNFNTDAKGYYYNKQKKRYMASIKAYGEYIYLGVYETEEEARKAYLDAKKRIHVIKRDKNNINKIEF